MIMVTLSLETLSAYVIASWTFDFDHELYRIIPKLSIAMSSTINSMPTIFNLLSLMLPQTQIQNNGKRITVCLYQIKISGRKNETNSGTRSDPKNVTSKRRPGNDVCWICQLPNPK